jgi:hypothetical protein
MSTLPRRSVTVRDVMRASSGRKRPWFRARRVKPWPRKAKKPSGG